MKELKIKISKGNDKMGKIKSVSLPPVTTCAKDAPCIKKCYARRLQRFPNVKNAYNNNLELFEYSPILYFKQITEAAQNEKYFRWHVAGDIVNAKYFRGVLDVARNTPNTEHLLFTKQYKIVNNELNYEELPNNLHIIFSHWEGFEMSNPHNLPESHVIFKGCEPLKNWRVCPGNCLECAINNINCWNLKQGEHIAFNEH